MKIDFQKAIFDEIKRQIQGKDNIGNVVSEVLSISPDAAYRRYRGETHLTINELQKLSAKFGISLDKLFETNSNKVLFDIQFFDEFDYSMESYLNSVLQNLQTLRSLDSPQLTVAINNTPFFQLFNFPHLVRFKLFFWAKTHLQIDEYRTVKFQHDRIADSTFAIGKEVLQCYNSIPSRELYDPDLLRGFIREIYYYFKAQHFEDPEYSFFLLDQVDRFIDHLHDQANCGKKFIYGTSAPANGNDWFLYHNETLNALTSIHYKAKEAEGLYIAHNFMNYIHTNDPEYVKDSVQVLEKQISHSSLISGVNEKERNSYFAQIKQLVSNYRKKIDLELSVD